MADIRTQTKRARKKKFILGNDIATVTGPSQIQQLRVLPGLELRNIMEVLPPPHHVGLLLNCVHLDLWRVV
jgi:hypothetical protein